MMRMTAHERAVKYRRLALAEPDPAKAKLLYTQANEAERGVLATAAWMTESGGETPSDTL